MRLVFAIIGLTLLGFVGFWLAGLPEDGSAEVSQEAASSKSERTEADQPAGDSSLTRSAKREVVQSTAPTTSSDFDPRLLLKSQEWNSQRGYYLDIPLAPSKFPDGGMIPEPTHPYQAYDDSTLSQLAEGNDMVASVILADRLIASPDAEQKEVGYKLHERAVVLGSTYSALVLGQDKLYLEPPEGYDAFDAKSDGLAWLLFASARGDPGGALALQLFTQSPALDPAELASACDKSIALRELMESKRQALGLPEFDDLPHPATDQVFESEGINRQASNCN